MSGRALFVLGVALVCFVAPPAAGVQAAEKVPRIGLLSIDWVPERIEAFREGLRQLGYVDGQNITLEVRDADGKAERLPELASDLVRLKVDIIVAGSSDSIRAAQQATRTIPIVMTVTGDPIGSGFVASLARPGGNITGLTSISTDLGQKRVQLIKEAIPRATRLAVIWRRENPAHRPALKEIDSAARALGMRLHLAEARHPEDLDGVFSSMTKARVGAVLVLGDTMFESQRGRIVNLAAMRRLPAIYFAKTFVEAGGLMSYAPDVIDMHRRAAIFVDKILKGTKPADLPVEQPTRFELVLNMKTAKALGLTFPQSILIRADQVIQ